MRLIHLWAVALLLCVACAQPAFAGPKNWRGAQFLSVPTAVTVDVVDLTAGTTVGDDLPATKVVVDSLNSTLWQFDLSTVTGYPTGCGSKTYLIVYIPDAADCSESGSPTTCAQEIVPVTGEECESPRSSAYVHTSSTVSAQGINSTVLSFYTARGTLPLLWIEHDFSGSDDYSSPDSTMWEVYFYTDAASSVRVKCTVETDVNPASALPSSSHCP